MVEDARPALILTQAARIEQVAAVKAEAVAVDRPDTFDGVSTDDASRRDRAERCGLRDVHVGLDRPTQGGHGHARQHPELLSEARSRVRRRSARHLAGDDQHFVRHLDSRTLLDAHSGREGRPPRIAQGGSDRGRAEQPRTAKSTSACSSEMSWFTKIRPRVRPTACCARLRDSPREHGFSVRPEGHADETTDPAGASPAAARRASRRMTIPTIFSCAAQIGANILTRLLGQPIETLAKNIALYRRTWKEAGHPGEGRVTLLVPTFVSANEQIVKNVVRGPLKAYLKRELSLRAGGGLGISRLPESIGRDGANARPILEHALRSRIERAPGIRLRALLSRPAGCLEPEPTAWRWSSDSSRSASTRSPA